MLAAQSEFRPAQSPGPHHQQQADRHGRDGGDIGPGRGEVRNQVGDRQHDDDHADIDVDPQMVQRSQLRQRRMGLSGLGAVGGLDRVDRGG